MKKEQPLTNTTIKISDAIKKTIDAIRKENKDKLPYMVKNVKKR